jgi:hypothetical protein
MPDINKCSSPFQSHLVYDISPWQPLPGRLPEVGS